MCLQTHDKQTGASPGAAANCSVRHGTCFRRRLTAHHASAAPYSAAAELGVVSNTPLSCGFLSLYGAVFTAEQRQKLAKMQFFSNLRPLTFEQLTLLDGVLLGDARRTFRYIHHFMDALADTIAYLFVYLNVAGEPLEGATRDDDDCKALESVDSFLQVASPAELSALHAATQRAISRKSAATPPRYDWLACYDDLLEVLAEQGVTPKTRTA